MSQSVPPVPDCPTPAASPDLGRCGGLAGSGVAPLPGHPSGAGSPGGDQGAGNRAGAPGLCPTMPVSPWGGWRWLTPSPCCLHWFTATWPPITAGGSVCCAAARRAPERAHPLVPAGGPAEPERRSAARSHRVGLHCSDLHQPGLEPDFRVVPVVDHPARRAREASYIFRFNGWLRFKTLQLPFAAISLIWNSMMSWAGGWFFLMAAEIFTVGHRNFQLPGIGSYLRRPRTGNLRRSWGLGVLVLVIVALDQLVWRPLLAWADHFKL